MLKSVADEASLRNGSKPKKLFFEPTSIVSHDEESVEMTDEQSPRNEQQCMAQKCRLDNIVLNLARRELVDIAERPSVLSHSW